MHDHDNQPFSIRELSLLQGQLGVAFELGEEPRTSGRSRRIRVVAAVAATTAVVAVTVALLTGSFAKTPLSTEDALAEVADATLAVGDPAPQQYLYSKFINHSYAPYPDRYLSQIEPPPGAENWMPGPHFDAFIDRQTESWLSLDRPGFVYRRPGQPSYPTETDRERAEAYLAKERVEMKKRGDDFRLDEGAGVGSFVIPESGFRPLDSNTYGFAPQKGYLFNGQDLSPEEAAALPTDPNEIVTRLRKHYAAYPGGVEDGVWSALADHFTPGYGVPLPAKQQAAVVKAIALVDGVESLGLRRDAVGREGVGFARSFGTMRMEIIFDRDTGQLIESKSMIASNDPPKLPPDQHMPEAYKRLPVGTVVDGFTLIDRRVADELPSWVIENLKQSTQQGKQRDLELYLR